MSRLLKQFVGQVTSCAHRLNLVQAVYSSSLLRYALLHTAIVVALCGTLLLGVQHLSLGYYQSRQNQFVQEQLNALNVIADGNSQAEFIAAVEKLADNSRQALVVLSNDKGYFGNLNYLPERVPLAPSTGRLWILGDSVLDEERLQEVQGSRIETRWGTLLVAYNSSDFNLFVSRFTRVIYLALLLALVTGLLSGFLFTRKVLGRLNQINQITTQVGEGKLAIRVPVTSTGDEFDTLAGTINQMLDKIEDAVEATSSVTNSIAHDLRTPLSRLRIRLDGYLQNGQAGADDLQAIQTELDTVLHTFSAMLELNKLEHRQRDIPFTKCHIGKICHTVIELAEPLAEANRQNLLLDIQYPLVIQGNQQLLFRAIFNLVENAVKYAPSDSLITVRIEPDSLSVIDQGGGISEGEQKKVFRRLYRVDQSRTTAGYGLGLSLVQAVINLHSARVGFKYSPEGFAAVILFGIQ